MERMEYDPEGGNYLPITGRESGTTLIVISVIMLLSALLWSLYVGWDIRAGGGLMETLFGLDVFIALLLMVLGFRKRNRQKK